MPWCPDCRTEYEAQAAFCADCGAKLVAELAPESLGTEPVIVAEAGDANEARVIVATLQAEGIPARTGAADPYLTQGGNPVASVSSEFAVWVPGGAAEAARALLAMPPVDEADLLAAEQATDPEPDVDEPIETEL
jgi:hypothetical protein